MKKTIAIVSAFCIVMAMAVCFAASGDGVDGFVSAVNEGITQDAMWDGVTPFVPLMVTIFVFAFSFGIFRKVTKKGSRGRFGV